jgi:hypothetical protein
VKTSSLRALAASGLLSMFAALGCGSSDAKSDPGPSIAACNTYCDKYIAAACTDSVYTTADECKNYECSDLPQAPAICQGKIKAFYDCENALSPADLCADVACDSKFNDVLTCSGN